jgi:predicted GIY-YIG superfamily endonuclease
VGTPHAAYHEFVIRGFAFAGFGPLIDSVHYVYLLESSVDPTRRYTGYTTDLKIRLADHNSGKNQSTVSGRPWRLTAYFAFEDRAVALAFERYLKSGSGKTFAKRHLQPPPSVRLAGQLNGSNSISGGGGCPP